MKYNLLAILILTTFIGGCTTTFVKHSKTSFDNHNKLLHQFLRGEELPAKKFELYSSGTAAIIEYEKYGEFSGEDTTEYKYKVMDRAGLKKELPTGIYPNVLGIQKDPDYQKFFKLKKFKRGAWEFISDKTLDPKVAYYGWLQSGGLSGGVKLYFAASLLEESGHILPAIQAYYAALIHFPKDECWSSDQSFVWYIAPAAMANIKRLCQKYPQLNLDYASGFFQIENGNDTDLSNDIIIFNPGKLFAKTLDQKKSELPNLNKLKIIATRGRGKVQFEQYENGHWLMKVNGKPFFIRGITYMPTRVGLSPQDEYFLDRWMTDDDDEDGQIDVAYQSWIDGNANGIQDPEEFPIGDFQLLKDAGINAIRLFLPNDEHNQYASSQVNMELLRELYDKYGVYVIGSDFLGAYTVGSGASWEEGTDYTNPQQRARMKELVRQKVLALKNEPFILMWLLGNENNMPSDHLGHNATRTNAADHPIEYAQFLNEVAEMIHTLDPNHPVGVGNIELGLLEFYNKYAPALDFIGMNSYRGTNGFQNLWSEARTKMDRPVLITEYGCDVYREGVGEDEEAQREYHEGNLIDIVMNQAGGLYEGNAIGGLIFEFLDEWWKDQGHPFDEHQTAFQYAFPFPDGYSHEEWFGIIGQGDGQNSPLVRHPRKAYYFYVENK